jgi:hypothetical protein
LRKGRIIFGKIPTSNNQQSKNGLDPEARVLMRAGREKGRREIADLKFEI